MQRWSHSQVKSVHPATIPSFTHHTPEAGDRHLDEELNDPMVPKGGSSHHRSPQVMVPGAHLTRQPAVVINRTQLTDHTLIVRQKRTFCHDPPLWKVLKNKVAIEFVVRVSTPGTGCTFPPVPWPFPAFQVVRPHEGGFHVSPTLPLSVVTAEFIVQAADYNQTISELLHPMYHNFCISHRKYTLIW